MVLKPPIWGRSKIPSTQTKSAQRETGRMYEILKIGYYLQYRSKMGCDALLRSRGKTGIESCKNP